jgi:hypothetical protein
MASKRYLKIDDLRGDAYGDTHDQAHQGWLQLLDYSVKSGKLSIRILEGDAAKELAKAIESKRVFKKAQIHLVEETHVIPMEFDSLQVESVGSGPLAFVITDPKLPMPKTVPFILAFGVSAR